MNQGLKTLRALTSAVVPMSERPNGRCRTCQSPLYWRKVQTATGVRNVPMEEAGHGGGGDKVLTRHRCG